MLIVINGIKSRTYKGAAAPAPVAEPAAPLWRATIAGAPPARRRAREIRLVRGLPRLVPSGEASAGQGAGLRHLGAPRPARPLAGALALELRVWRADARAGFDD